MSLVRPMKLRSICMLATLQLSLLSLPAQESPTPGVIEFESVKKAIEAYESREYQTALAILKGSAERDVRIIEGTP